MQHQNKDTILSSKAWLSWQEFNKIVRNKKAVFFGVSDDWTEKTFQKSNLKLVY